MDATQLIDYVVTEIQDDSFGRTTDILPLLNEAIFDVAAHVVLPETITSETLTIASGESIIDLPDDFFRRAMFCNIISESTIDGTTIKILPGLSAFFAKYPGMQDSGTPKHCCVVGAKLYIQPAPTEETSVKLVYTVEPATLSSDSDGVEVEGIPYELQRSLLVSYVASKIMATIEDGMEGSRKINTVYHQGVYLQALAALKRTLGGEYEQPDFVQDHDVYEDRETPECLRR